MKLSHLRSLPFLTVMLLTSSAANAAYDMSGHWLMRSDQPFYHWNNNASGQGDWHLHLAQAAGTLTSAGPDNFAGTAGTLDEGTGDFELEAAAGVIPCSALQFTGTVSPDGQSFTGTYSYVCTGSPTFTQYPYSGSITGTRCGNGQIDGGEQCDDSNVESGDCCSSSCTTEAQGATCTADDDACTLDTCDSGGSCVHTPHTSACTEVHGCGTGSCATGSCVVTSPATAGQSCDSDDDACTLDVCDGAGACSTGAALDCSPCGGCSPELGCVAEFGAPDVCIEEAAAGSLSVRTGADPRKAKMTLKIKEPSNTPEFADPTDEADYAFCILEDIGQNSRPRPILALAAIPAAATGWTSVGVDYRYKDSQRINDGISAASLKVGKGIQSKAAGLNFALPDDLSAWPLSLTALIVATADGTDRCWRYVLQTKKRSATSYMGKYVPPSGE